MTTSTVTPPLRFYSVRRDAPTPQPADPRAILNPVAFPLCVPGLDATGLGYDLPAPLAWALRRTDAGMQVGWIGPHDTIDWIEPDEHGTTYHPEGAAILDGFPLDRVRNTGKIVLPGRGLQFANVKPSRPGFIEVISGWTFHGEPGWGLMTGAPTNRDMPTGVRVLNGYFRPWFAGILIPTVYQIREVGIVARFDRGDPMSLLVPLPDAARTRIEPDDRQVSAGIGEWPADLTAKAAALWGDIYDTDHPGRYAAEARRAYHPGGDCPHPGGGWVTVADEYGNRATMSPAAHETTRRRTAAPASTGARLRQLRAERAVTP
jgi:hypothetical protein